jgi:HSP20 family protein
MALVRTRPPRSWGMEADPFDTLDRLFERMTAPSLAPDGDVGQAYPYDLYETDDALVLEMAVPGVTADAIDLAVEGRQLTIRATVPEAESEGRRYWTQGIPRGEIGRTVKLPAGIDLDGVQARVRDGLLVLTLPKVQEAKVKKIAIERG